MIGYLLNRLLAAVFIILALVLVTFVLLRLAGDPSETLLPIDASPALREQLRSAFGLDRPILIQYFRYTTSALTGQFGHSWRYGVPVIDLLLQRFVATLELVLLGTLVAGFIGVTLGVYIASSRNRLVDVAATSLTVFGQSVPSFWLGIVLVIIFSVKLGWLPTSGRGQIAQLILPVITVAAGLVAEIMNIVKTSVAEVLNTDYVRYARAKGLSNWLVLRKHVARNALVSLLSLLSVQVGTLISGTVIVEYVFSWPGVGLLAVESVLAHDFPVVQGAVILFGACIISINLLLDIVYGVIDPRISVR